MIIRLNIAVIAPLMCIVILFFISNVSASIKLPVVLNTWPFTDAAAKAWDVLYYQEKTPLDAVEAGCSQCEIDQCDTTVGYGGSPDENGETTLDAMIMDGSTHDVGAVADLRRIKSAISVARMVLHHTNHTLLVGDQATKFAVQMGFKEENLSTIASIQQWNNWKQHDCQPSFWKNVYPDPRTSCGPFKPGFSYPTYSVSSECINAHNHDTIGMIAIDKTGTIAAGTSTNGAKFKIPGRVGDSPIPGAGAYVDQKIGGAAATGDGDVMMRFLPSYQTVENLRNGMDPMTAAQNSLFRIIDKYPSFQGAVIAAKIDGEFGAACHGLQGFKFSVVNEDYQNVTVKEVACV